MVNHEACGTPIPRVQFSWLLVLAYSRDVKNINESQMREKFTMT